jgi:hypothetical protein
MFLGSYLILLSLFFFFFFLRDILYGIDYDTEMFYQS